VLLAALVGHAECKGGGVPTRTYGKPNNPNSAYKYAAAGAVGGALVGYWVGSRRYAPSYGGYGYNSYDEYHADHDDDDDWGRRYGGTNRRRTNCQPRVRVPEASATRAYVWVQAAIGQTRAQFTPMEFEVDLFRDLVWRSPCNVPTQTLISYVCSVPRARRILASDQNRPSTCQYLASVSSVHEDARRKLLQGGATVIEIAIGIRDFRMRNDMLQAVRESLDDPHSSIRQLYKTNVTANPATQSSILHHEFHESAATARALQAVMLGVIGTLVSLVL